MTTVAHPPPATAKKTTKMATTGVAKRPRGRRSPASAAACNGRTSRTLRMARRGGRRRRSGDRDTTNCWLCPGGWSPEFRTAGGAASSRYCDNLPVSVQSGKYLDYVREIFITTAMWCAGWLGKSGGDWLELKMTSKNVVEASTVHSFIWSNLLNLIFLNLWLNFHYFVKYQVYCENVPWDVLYFIAWNYHVKM